MKYNFPKYNLEVIIWSDSYGVGSSWSETSDIDICPHYCFSVGWVIKETNDAIAVVPHLSHPDNEEYLPEQGCGDMVIPKCSIVRRISLSGLKKAKK